MLYIVKFSDGSYFNASATQITYRSEDAKRLTKEEAEEIYHKAISCGCNKPTIILV